MVKRKGRTFPYFDVDINSITKTGKTMTIVDRNTIQVVTDDVDGKPKRVYNSDEDTHIVKTITIPAETAADRKRITAWMLEIADPRYSIVYDHRRNSFHVEYATDVWLEYLASKYEEEADEDELNESEEDFEEEEDSEIEYSEPEEV